MTTEAEAPVGDALRRWFAVDCLVWAVGVNSVGVPWVGSPIFAPWSTAEEELLTGWPGFGRGVEYARKADNGITGDGYVVTVEIGIVGNIKVTLQGFGWWDLPKHEGSHSTDPAEALFAAIWSAREGG